MFSVGSVPYLNAKPLVWGFSAAGAQSPVSVRFDVPSKLPSMLASGDVQAILVSSVEALRSPDARVAAGVSISSRHDVLSVRVFSKLPFKEVRSLALDKSSMTSNALARIIFAETYRVSPLTEHAPPDLDAMLARHDAAVLIGDNGMRAKGEGLHVLDLGRAWDELTGLPFVWAMWLGNDELTPTLAGHLAASAAEGRRDIADVLASLPTDLGIEPSLSRTYLTEIMDYDLSEKHLDGLAEFASLLRHHGLVPNPQMPTIVDPSVRVYTP